MMNRLPSAVRSHLMRYRLPIVVLVLVLLPAVCLRADDLLFTRLTDYLEALRVRVGIPGLSAVVVGPEDILWEHAFGHQDIGRSISSRTDTPFQLDGLTQLFTAVMTLRCVEEGSLSLDDRIGSFDRDSPDAAATIEEVLTHTSGPPGNLVFAYRPERLAPLTRVVRAPWARIERRCRTCWIASRWSTRCRAPTRPACNRRPKAFRRQIQPRGMRAC
jgi:CubicO group peptidase (beta-lactamase class C family)